MKLSPSWKASQEITRNLWSPKVRYCCCKWTWSIQDPNIPSKNPMSLFSLLRSYQSVSSGLRLSVWTFRKKIRFYGEELLAHRPILKLKDHPLSAVRDCLFNIFATTLHIGGLSSIRNLRTKPCRGDRDPLLAPRLKNEYSYTPTPLQNLVACHRPKFTFTFTFTLR
jgi:hypothetical protein